MKTCKRCNGLGFKLEAMMMPNMSGRGYMFAMETHTIKVTCKSCHGKGMK